MNPTELDTASFVAAAAAASVTATRILSHVKKLAAAAAAATAAAAIGSQERNCASHRCALLFASGLEYLNKSKTKV